MSNTSPKHGNGSDQNTDAEVDRHTHQGDVRYAANPRSHGNDQRQQSGQHVAQTRNESDDSVDSEADRWCRECGKLHRAELQAAARSDRGRSTRPFVQRSGSSDSRIRTGFRAVFTRSDWALAGGFGTGEPSVSPISFDATIERVYGGYSSAAERLTVAQDVVGSIPTSRPNRK